MPELELQRFVAELHRAGVAPRHIGRACEELNDHVDDLYLDALDAGLSAADASALALSRIGDLRDVANAIAMRPELKRWSARFPLVALVCLPLAYVLLLPAVPISAGIAQVPVIARWGASMMLGAAVTAGMFLVLQLFIAFS
jgi:hypothetical protein